MEEMATVISDMICLQWRHHRLSKEAALNNNPKAELRSTDLKENFLFWHYFMFHFSFVSIKLSLKDKEFCSVGGEALQYGNRADSVQLPMKVTGPTLATKLALCTALRSRAHLLASHRMYIEL